MVPFTKRGIIQKDEDILKNLMVEASNPRERQRLNRLKCEHSGAWVCAVPSTHDGNDTVMRPRNFQVAVAMRDFRFWMRRKVVHCVCKSLMYLVTTPPAAQCLLIVFIVITEFATC